ncbi:HD-GYP domain-containing protein [Acetobacter vaccinii]|uniref:HD domain-containing protein n=1 Tax=Acetobacter vaccinii TaxID=2592655 RepID=A0A5C1YUW8_9PROT|nr:HD domain-containing phosphohydrolase [Acetobacter vaccinii]QEO18922.1 HD domain-containing protein [Acetobacter vaccinii]
MDPSPRGGRGLTRSPSLSLEALARTVGAALEGHGNRVAAMACALLPGGLPSRLAEADLDAGARLHDVGKLLTPPSILHAPGRLTPPDWWVMQRHVLDGAALVHRLAPQASPVVFQCVLLHHERWDGTGYPGGLRREAIPVAARLVAIADFVDALLSPRAYKPALSPPVVRDMLAHQRGVMFDPALVDRALANYPVLLRVRGHVRAHNSPSYTGQHCDQQGEG